MISIVIQAGGQSKRMGQDKGLASLGGKPMIEHVLLQVEELGDEVIITTNNPKEYEYLGKQIATDRDPGAGALPGLQTALDAAEGSTVFVIACDMPFPNKSFISYLLSLAPRADTIVPFFEDRYQPLHAVYSRESCLPAIENSISLGQKRVVSFYPQIKVLKIEEDKISEYTPDGLSFFNVNTPNDLAKAELILAKKQLNLVSPKLKI